MVVDDDPESCANIKKALEQVGFKKVTTVNSGVEVVQMLKGEESPDILILDLRLSDWPGVDLLPRIKEAWPETRVLIYTGKEEKNHEYLEVIRYVSGFLKKSENLNRLVRCVQETSQDMIA